MFNNNYNPYYIPQQRYMPTQQLTEPMQQSQYIPQQYGKFSVLQGKQVDSIDVVKATDIPFDGISYFPLTDGSCIVTKQIQIDGTSKIVVFKPIEEQKEENRYITQDDLKNALNELNLDELEDIKEELKDIRKQLKRKGE